RPSVRKVVLLVLAVTFFSFIVLPWFGGFATDWLWFREVHFEPVFLTSLLWKTGLFVSGAAIAFGFVYGNVRMRTAELSGFPRLFLAGAILVAFMPGLSASVLWMTMLMALHGATVGAVDSLFGRDVGFYLFTLPAVSALLNTLVVLTMVSLVASAVVYG